MGVKKYYIIAFTTLILFVLLPGLLLITKNYEKQNKEHVWIIEDSFFRSVKSNISVKEHVLPLALGKTYRLRNNTVKTYGLKNNTNKTIKVLYWTYQHFAAKRRDSPSWGYGSKAFEMCAYKCETTSNRSFLQQSDVVYINPRLLGPKSTEHLPKYRQPNQIWLLVTFESPLTYSIPGGMRRSYNATYTYSHKSDITMERVKFVKNTGNSQGYNWTLFQPNLVDKKKLAAWVISHCLSKSHREKLVDAMKQYIDIDVYGKCGSLKCPEEEGNKLACHIWVSQRYLFYMAFENTLCTEYATEKVYRSLQLGLIPVVYGAANYTELLPSNSYIDVGNFSSVKDLTDYMQLVARSESLYSSYFEWRRSFIMQTSVYNPCDACKAFHKLLEQKSSRVIDLDSFWNPKRNCSKPRGMLPTIESRADPGRS